MEYICFIPVETKEDEALALRYFYCAHGFNIIDINNKNFTGGFIGFYLNEDSSRDLSFLTNFTFKSILMSRDKTKFVIASIENEIFYVVSRDDINKYSSHPMKLDEFQTYFNRCMKHCEVSHCANQHYPESDLQILTRIWENTVN